jgi:PAS domain S-box-containing protein
MGQHYNLENRVKDENKTKAQLIKELKQAQKQLQKRDTGKKPEEGANHLEDKDQVLKMITENVSDLIAIVDLEGKRIFNSNSYRKLFGDPTSLTGTDSFREIHEDDREKIKQIFSETVATGIGQMTEYRFVLEDGSIRHIESQGDVIKNSKGEVEKVIVISRDVTEREQIEQALHDSEERLKSIFRSIPDIIYRLDPEGKITFISAAIERYGYHVSDLLGQSIINLVHPEDKEKAKYRINERRTGERRTKSFELRLVTAKGKSVYFEDRTASVPMEPVFLLEAEGIYATSQPQQTSFVGTQGIARDITDRKKTEGEISMLAQALKCISECVTVTDLENNIIFVNDAFLKKYGYESHELIGKPISIVRAQTIQNDSVENILPDTMSGGWKGEVLNKKKDGTEFPVHLSTSVINDPTGYPLALIGVATDISERKRLETQLQQSQKLEAIGKLAGGIAHDFNNLLTVIQGYSDLLLAKISANDPIHNQIRQIYDAANRAESLTGQLLAFSRKQLMKPRVIDLNKLIHEMEDMLERLIGADIKFVINLSANLGKIKADPGQIEQVIMNLAVNARDAMNNGGILTIETLNTVIDQRFKDKYPEAVVGNYIELRIGDTGFGMDKETQAHIFEPFFTTKEKGEGTGLGLATVYGIIKQSGGYIYVESELTKGTIFNLYFPRVDEPLDIEESTKISDTNLYGEETVLVVEDQNEVRHLIIDTLKLYGYNVLEAPHGGSALLTCEKFRGKIDLIISDIVMPQMNGQELVERLIPLQPQMKTLFISGYSENVFSDRNILDPGMLYVQKPFTPMELLRKIRQVLDSD